MSVLSQLRCFSSFSTFWFLCLSLMLAVTGDAHAGTIEGRVHDVLTRTGIPSATVTIEPGDVAVETDDYGRFRVDGLRPGVYRMEVTHVSYHSAVESVDLAGDRPASLQIGLRPKTVPVGAITVTPSRMQQDEFTLPMSVSITTGETFAESNPSTTADLLKDQPGILIQKTTHAHGSPVIRGLLGKYVLLLYDGIRLNKPTFRFGANQYLNTVNREALDRIEVVRGPASVMFGSDAMGGVINMLPINTPYDTSQVHLGYEMGSRFSSADDSYAAHIGLVGSGRKLSGSYHLAYKRAGDLRAGGNIGIQQPTGWLEADHAARLNYRLGPGSELRLDVLNVRQTDVPRYDKYVSGDFDQYVYDPQDRYLAALSFANSQPGPFFSNFRVALAYQKELEGTTMRRTGATEITRSSDELATWGGYCQFLSVVKADHWLTYGTEIYVHRLTSWSEISDGVQTETARPTYPDGSRYWEFGFYLQDEWSATDRLRFTGGVRYSLIGADSPLEEPFGRYHDRFADLTGSLALSYLINPIVNLVGRWSRGFRAPSLNDAVVLKYSSSGVDAPSPDLHPENCNNFELGAKLSGQRGGGNIFVFYNLMDDLMERAPGSYDGLTFFDENGDRLRDPGEYGIYQKVNSGTGRIYGLELSGRLKSIGGLSAESDLSWTFGENTSDHQPLSRIPPVMGRLAIGREIAQRVTIRSLIRFAGRQDRLSSRDLDDSRIDPEGTPGWCTLSMIAHFELEPVTVDLILDNLLDETYKLHGSGIYSAGRHVALEFILSGL